MLAAIFRKIAVSADMIMKSSAEDKTIPEINMAIDALDSYVITHTFEKWSPKATHNFYRRPRAPPQMVWWVTTSEFVENIGTTE